MGASCSSCNGSKIQNECPELQELLALNCESMVSQSSCRNFAHSQLEGPTPKGQALSSEASPTSAQGSPKSVRELGSPSGGECLLFLERVVNVPSLQSAFCSAGGSGSPSVRAWAEDESGKVVGKAASWPARHCNNAPSWYTAYSLGFSMGRTDVARLKFELWDLSVMLGSVDIPYEQQPGHRRIEMEFEMRPEAAPSASGSACSVSFQVLDAREVLAPKTVFLVRHGESSWNKAQSKLDLYEMGRQSDHGLSPEGLKQAEALGERLEKETKDKRLLNPDVIYVSPLTRAVQTAVVGFRKVLSEPTTGELVLMANAREKQNFGGFDSQPMAIGSGVIKRTLDELVLLYQDQNRVKGMVNAFRKLKFDTQEVEGRWWNPVAAESDAEVKTRLHDFMAQLKHSSHRNIVVVGHSHFFRAVFKEFLADSFKEKQQDFAHQLSTLKLCNCGVARLDLDPSITSGGPITNAELLLGTTLTGAGGLCNCSGPPPSLQEHELKP